MNYTPYMSSLYEASFLKNVPMTFATPEHLAKLRKQLRKVCPNKRVVIRFRGPRKGDGRSGYAQQSDCRRGTANRFSVYFREVYR